MVLLLQSTLRFHALPTEPENRWNSSDPVPLRPFFIPVSTRSGTHNQGDGDFYSQNQSPKVFVFSQPELRIDRHHSRVMAWSDMPAPLGFISYDFKLSENERKRLIEGISNCGEPFNVDDWSAERKAPREDWDKLVHSKIWRSDFLIVLVATDMNQDAVALEIMEAKQCNVPFFGIYVGDAKVGTSLPPGLPANRVIPNDWSRIALAVRQVAKEGKHHTFS